MVDLLKKYNLKKSQYEYELKRSKKNNLSIEDWLRYKFSKKNSQLVDEKNRIRGRSLVIDLLDNFGQETGFLLDKSLQKRLGNYLLKHKTFNMFVYWVDDIQKKKKRGERQYEYEELQELTHKEFDTLLDLEVNIKNTELFWIMFGFFRNFFRFLTHKEKQIKKMLKRFDRSNVSLLYRSQWVEYFDSLGQCIVDDNYEKLQRLLNERVDDLIQINKKYSDLDYIEIYRGFQLREGETNIRSELNRKKQKVGKGFYYTLNKDYGKFYTMNSNIYGHFSMYLYNYSDNELIEYFKGDGQFVSDIGKLKIDREEFSKNKKYRKEIFKTDIYKNYVKGQILHTSNNDFQKVEYRQLDRGIIGTYKVRKKDILFFSDTEKQTFNILLHEQSVFCFDEDVELVRYDYLTQKDYSRINKLQVKTSKKN